MGVSFFFMLLIFTLLMEPLPLCSFCSPIMLLFFFHLKKKDGKLCNINHKRKKNHK